MPKSGGKAVTYGDMGGSVFVYAKNDITKKIEKVAVPAGLQVGLQSSPAELLVTGRISLNSIDVSLATGQTYTIPDNTTVVNVSLSGSPGSVTVTLPYFPRLGQVLIIKDYSGNAGTINIAVVGTAAQLIDGSLSNVISSDSGSLYLIWQGNGWIIVTSGGGGGGAGAQGAQGPQGSSGTGAQGFQGDSIVGPQGPQGQDASAYVFPTDIRVSLSRDKTFGRYASGETIPATGKTPAEVILLATAEPIDPTVSLVSTTSIEYNQTIIRNDLIFGYTINSLDATVTSVLLEWRRNNYGPWTSLTTNPALTTYTHSYTDSDYNSQPFNYRYTVVDSMGASKSATFDITPAAYVPPTISFSIVASSPGGITGETNIKREKGNVGSGISGTITKNSTNVGLIRYSVQYQPGGGTWSDVPGLSSVVVTGDPPTVTIPTTSHNNSTLKTYSSIAYRVVVSDGQQLTNSSVITVNFLNVIFYGPVASRPYNSTDIRSIGNKIFTDGSNPFNLVTGTVYNEFVTAMPASLSISNVVDLDALSADITSNYSLSSFNVADAGGTSTSYHVYDMLNAGPYTSGHRHQITRV
jgi:hypothetical protein